MTFTLFIMLFTIGALVASLLTEAIKKAFDNAGKSYSANAVALLLAIVVGVGGTSAAYIFMDIPFEAKSILCIVFMAITIWIGAMVGYDKVTQLLEQIIHKNK